MGNKLKNILLLAYDTFLENWKVILFIIFCVSFLLFIVVEVRQDFIDTQQARIQNKIDCEKTCNKFHMIQVDCGIRTWKCYNPRTERVETFRDRR